MAEASVLYDVADGVATITLNRPDKRNALNQSVVSGVRESLARAGDDEAVRVVALRGAGKDFCSGADLAEIERIGTMTRSENVTDAMTLGTLFMEMRAHPNPIVAVVHGRALAGGCGLATACDLVVAEADARFGYPEVHLGFVPAMVMAILRRKVGEAVAFDLVTGGHRITAEEAHRVGLINRVWPPDEFGAEASRFLSDLAKRPPSAISMTKRLLYDQDALGFEDGIRLGAEVNADARQTPACREGVRAFLERSRAG